METAKERLSDVYPESIPGPGHGEDPPDYVFGFDVLADVLDEGMQEMDERISELANQQEEIPTISEVMEEFAGLEDLVKDIEESQELRLSALENRISAVRDLAEQVDEETVVSRRLDEVYEGLMAVKKNRRRNTDRIGEVEEDLAEVEEELEALKEGEYDYDAIAGLTGRLEERIVENTERLNGADEGREGLFELLVDKARTIETLGQAIDEIEGRLEEVEARVEGEDFGPIGKELEHLSETQLQIARLGAELESRVEDIEEGMDVQGEERAEPREPVQTGGEATGRSSGGAVRMKPPPSVPRWHDHPPEPGVYVRVDDKGGEPRVTRVAAPSAIKSMASESFYGPIPESGTPLETHV